MQGTRDRILEVIVRRREVRVEELAAEFRITQPAVRRHLDNLRADGFVDVRTVHQATGRPYYAYFATAQATPGIPPAYSGLLEGMLRGLAESDALVNSAVATSVASHVAESLASRHRSEVGDLTSSAPAERVEQVTESLRNEGILESWHAESDGFHLVNGACPYMRAAEISKLPCESDRKAIELLLGLDVAQLNRIVDGSPICEYLVHSGHDTTVDTPEQLIETR
jgi:predicted ArsR family transcriptional regulator